MYKIRSDNSLDAKYFQKGIVYTRDNIKVKKQKKQSKESCIIFITTVRKKSIDYIKEMLEEEMQRYNLEEYEIIVVLVDYYKDSMINTKYINTKLTRGVDKSIKIKYICVEHNENDNICRIEDEYNEEYTYKHLSRSYKANLKKIVSVLMATEKIVSEKEREIAYADSSLV